MGGETTTRRVRLEQQRDQALRDLLELDQQVRAGEVPAGSAEQLRRRYERSAAEALSLLEEDHLSETPARARRTTWRTALYGAGAVGAVVALAVVLPPALQQRPEGGFVSGNEVFDTESPPAPSAGRDLSTVTDAEMEEVIAANPDVVGMRLALAKRYLDQGAFDQAIPHYLQVLEREPDNPVATASLAWVLLWADRPADARRVADKALSLDPTLPLAWWVEANLRLYGEDDPQGAVEALQRMQDLPLEPEVEQQVATLMDDAQAQLTAGGGDQ